MKENEYELKIASQITDVKKTGYLKTYVENGKTLHVTAADFADIMANVAGYMKKASSFGSNKHQKDMCNAYVEHF